MRLTRRAEYAIRAAVDLASQPPGRSVLSREIAERQEIPLNFAAHVIGDLIRAGIARATRGSGGGVSLAVPASEVSLRRIIEAVEGPIALNECLLGRSACNRRDGCSIAGVWERAQEGMLKVLEEATIAELAGPQSEPELRSTS